MSPVRILALNHYFGQDLDALKAHGDLDIRTISFERLRDPALRIMGPEVATGLESMARRELAPALRRYASWLQREVEKLYLERDFDVLVLPSDSFFYVRALPEAAHALGVPVVTVQKETTVSPYSMKQHSKLVRRYAPSISDVMTVCSEDQKRFWVGAGTDERKVFVTGQPRFDLYAQHFGPPAGPLKRVLFLSYELDAYEPGVGGGMGRSTWRSLRDETEQVLVASGREGHCHITIKPHPQQSRDGHVERLSKMAGPMWDKTITLADPNADVRRLIADSNLVVGFQTTALYESVAAGRPTVYTAWGAEFQRHRVHLVPFDEAPAECLTLAHSPRHLNELLRSRFSDPTGRSCRAWVERALGPLDGKATERVARILEGLSLEWPRGIRREQLDRRRSSFSLQMLVRSAAKEAVWAFAYPPAATIGRGAGAKARRESAMEARRLALEALRAPRP